MAKISVAEDTYLVGIGVSPGISIGEISIVDQRPLLEDTTISADQIDTEISRLHDAISVAKAQLTSIKETVSRQQHLREHLYILDTHILILDDDMLVNGTVDAIRSGLSADSALKKTLDHLRRLFDDIQDDYLKERRSDVDAVGERLLRTLTGASERTLSNLGRKSLVVAHDISPAETMQIDRSCILGFMTDKGGRTSHSAILARSLNIPAVVGMDSITTLVNERMPAIIDGSTGIVVLNPSAQTFKEYLSRKQQYDFLEEELDSFRDLPAVMTDGTRIALRANVEIASDFKLAARHAAEGVGLFRTEFLFLGRDEPPDEEEQYQAYRDIVEAADGAPVTIRTLDIGGDKFVPELNLDDEPNPAMGLRAIRFSLHEEKLFKTQLRAILRASDFGTVRLMFPMISGVAEVRSCRQMLRNVQRQLDSEGIAYDAEMQIGIMVETPSAVMIAHLLAEEVDFFSIGTNDLAQYTLAVDRGNEHVAYLYDPLHPAVLRALKSVCDAANEASIPVCICGEMASEPLYALALAGLGLQELSMNPVCIPRVKRVLRRVSKEQGQALIEKLLKMPVSRDVANTIDKEMYRLLPDLFVQSPL